MQRGTFPSMVTVLFVYLHPVGGMRSAGSQRPLPCKAKFLSPSLSSAPQILQFFQCDNDSNQHPETETKPSSAADKHLERRFPGLEPHGGREAAGLGEQCRPELWGQVTRAQPCCDRQRPDARRTCRTRSLVAPLRAAPGASLQDSPTLACGSSGFPESRMAGPRQDGASI